MDKKIFDTFDGIDVSTDSNNRTVIRIPNELSPIFIQLFTNKLRLSRFRDLPWLDELADKINVKIAGQNFRYAFRTERGRYVCSECLLGSETEGALPLTEDDIVFITEGRDHLFCDSCSESIYGIDRKKVPA